MRWAARLTLSSLAIPAALVAQPQVGAVTGVVSDAAGAPIARVEVWVEGAGSISRTDSAGAFLLEALPSGPVDVSFRRLAFEPVVLRIQVPRGDTTEVEVTLKIVAQVMTGVVVQAEAARLRQLDAFEARRKLGIGHFITRAQIERRHASLLSDMVRMIPGARLVTINGQTVLRFARNARPSCPPQFFVDGVQVTGYNIDDMPVGDVEGVELYPGGAGLPPEYNRIHSTVNCGAVIIWTRIPGT